MKTFDPLKTRAEQGLKPLPQWLFSLSGQRELLRTKGLHEVIVSNEHGVWHTVEKIPEVDQTLSLPTLDKDGNDLRGDRTYPGSTEIDAQTIAERKRHEDHIAFRMKKMERVTISRV